MRVETQTVTVVSGLPRSGTSMMMRILEAGGMEVLTDEIRKADVDNPRGYYEFEPVKRTKHDPSWIPEASGKAVKMVYQLLYDLPEGFHYSVLMMQRDLNEVLRSQQKMLVRLGKSGDDVPQGTLAAMFRGQMERARRWLESQPRFSLLEVAYNEMVAEPLPQVERINAFLGGHLDVDAMCAAVEPQLYRNRRDG